MRVFVYRNLKNNKWSIKCVDKSPKYRHVYQRVVGYASSVFLTSVKPKVSEPGRQRVIKEKRKNVHAGLVGRLDGVFMWECRNYDVTDENVMVSPVAFSSDDHIGETFPIAYNPYKFNTFVNKHNTEQMLLESAIIRLLPDGRVYATGPKFKNKEKQLDLFFEDV